MATFKRARDRKFSKVSRFCAERLSQTVDYLRAARGAAKAGQCDRATTLVTDAVAQLERASARCDVSGVAGNVGRTLQEINPACKRTLMGPKRGRKSRRRAR
jgi:hypothetical protein